jgi:hypothetical protein
LGGRAVIWGGGWSVIFLAKYFWFLGKIPYQNTMYNKERNEKVVDGDVGGGGDEESPQKNCLGPLKSSGQPCFLVAVTVQYTVYISDKIISANKPVHNYILFGILQCLYFSFTIVIALKV